MSLFAESSWEKDTIGDKLSNEIFQKNAKSKKNINIKRSELLGKKLTTKHAKRKFKKRQKAILEAAESGSLHPKKWERKSKVEPIDATMNSVGEQEESERQKLPPKEIVSAETKSQRKRRKLKLKKSVPCQNIGASNDEKNSSDALKKKSNTMKNLNVKRLEAMLQIKEKMKNNENKREPESLRDRMMSQLRASRFRFLNETLYNSESSQSKNYFKEDPEAFAAYHAGYKQQVEQWPLNPLDVVISSIGKMPKDYVIADFGCGEARLAESVSQKVHSFDLVAVNERVKACDMAHTSLLTSGVNVVVFCLSLMGTNLADYLLEANRVLKINGIMKIADIESRFENVDDFIKQLKSYGFVNTWKDFSQNLFYFMDFKKVSECNRNTKNLPQIVLKSCLYKKR